ncbi:hypothetical protein Misp03_70350 [Microbispora sp. NBRC 16548]|nr:hypothetical protein Misp03_70350 [Microbispora sp. NBRC 16548]
MSNAETGDIPFGARVRGCLLGGAVGDALGAPVEFDSIASIRRDHGRAGLTDLAPDWRGETGLVTDDTQMTLFTVEGLIRADVRVREKGIGGGEVQVVATPTCAGSTRRSTACRRPPTASSAPAGSASRPGSTPVARPATPACPACAPTSARSRPPACPGRSTPVPRAAAP